MSVTGESPDDQEFLRAFPQAVFLRDPSFDVMTAVRGMWPESSAGLHEKFVSIRGLIKVFADNFSAAAGETWQSFHSVTMPDGLLQTWIIGDNLSQTLHVVTNRLRNEGVRQKLHYAEFVVHSQVDKLSSARGIAVRNDARVEPWTRESLGACASMETYGSSELSFLRGERNARPMIFGYTPSPQNAIQQWGTNVMAGCGLEYMERSLIHSVAGGCHEANVTGLFY